LGWPALVQSLATLFFMEPLVRHDLRRFDGLMTLRLLPWIRARREADALIYEEIAAHRADSNGGSDILSMLMAARDEQGRARLALHADSVRRWLAPLHGALKTRLEK
jgi:cytochrome P450